MTKNHVHALPFERVIARKTSSTQTWLLKKFSFEPNRFVGLVINMLMWFVVIAMTLLLGMYLKLSGTTILILMFISLVAHEMGHYYEMMKAFVPVEEVGVGLPFGLFRRLQYQVQILRLPFRLMLSPLWIAFYVDEGESGKPVLDSLDYKTKARIFAAGPTVNLVLFLILMAGLPLHGFLNENVSPGWLGVAFSTAAILTAVLIIRWWFPERAHIFSPVMGVTVIALLVISVWGAVATDPVQAISNGGSLAGEPPAVIGPVTMIQMMAHSADLIGGGPLLAIHLLIAVLNFGLAAANFLPVVWFDGGQIWGALLDEKYRKKYPKLRKEDRKKKTAKTLYWTTVVVFTPLIIVLAFSEVSGLMSWLLIGVILLLVLAHIVEKRLGTVNECVQTCTT